MKNMFSILPIIFAIFLLSCGYEDKTGESIKFPLPSSCQFPSSIPSSSGGCVNVLSTFETLLRTTEFCAIASDGSDLYLMTSDGSNKFVFLAQRDFKGWSECKFSGSSNCAIAETILLGAYSGSHTSFQDTVFWDTGQSWLSENLGFAINARDLYGIFRNNGEFTTILRRINHTTGQKQSEVNLAGSTDRLKFAASPALISNQRLVVVDSTDVDWAGRTTLHFYILDISRF